MQSVTKPCAVPRSSSKTFWLWWGVVVGFLSQLGAFQAMVVDPPLSDAVGYALVISGGVVGCLCLAVGAFCVLMRVGGPLPPALESCFPLRGRWLGIAISTMGALLISSVVEVFVLVLASMLPNPWVYPICG